MKWRTASISLLLATLAALLVALFIRPLPDSEQRLFSAALSREDIQLGYYDLLSRQREVYDPHFARNKGKTILTLTSPDDNRFVIKVNLQRVSDGADGITYDYQPLYYTDSTSARIIMSILGPGGHHRVQFHDLRVGDRQLILFPSGQILNVRAE